MSCCPGRPSSRSASRCGGTPAPPSSPRTLRCGITCPAKCTTVTAGPAWTCSSARSTSTPHSLVRALPVLPGGAGGCRRDVEHLAGLDVGGVDVRVGLLDRADQCWIAAGDVPQRVSRLHGVGARRWQGDVHDLAGLDVGGVDVRVGLLDRVQRCRVALRDGPQRVSRLHGVGEGMLRRGCRCWSRDCGRGGHRGGWRRRARTGRGCGGAIGKPVRYCAGRYADGPADQIPAADTRHPPFPGCGGLPARCGGLPAGCGGLPAGAEEGGRRGWLLGSGGHVEGSPAGGEEGGRRGWLLGSGGHVEGAPAGCEEGGRRGWLLGSGGHVEGAPAGAEEGAQRRRFKILAIVGQAGQLAAYPSSYPFYFAAYLVAYACTRRKDSSHDCPDAPGNGAVLDDGLPCLSVGERFALHPELAYCGAGAAAKEAGKPCRSHGIGLS